MAFDAPRKTLDDIRREIDAEYPQTVAPIGADHAAVIPSAVDVPARPFPGDEQDAFDAFYKPAVEERRGGSFSLRGRGGYIAAGLIGCVVGQLVLLGYQAATRHMAASSAPDAGVPASRVEAALAPAPSVLAAPSWDLRSLSEPNAPSDALVSEPAAPRVVPSAIPVPVANQAKPASRRMPRPSSPSAVASRPAASTAPSEPPRRIANADDWVRSEEEVRAALRDWLSRSNHNALDVRVVDTVVILGADGRTARTHVPMRSAEGVVIHELRWKHEADRWSVVDTREAWRAR
jgi:hypothetical protein